MTYQQVSELIVPTACTIGGQHYQYIATAYQCVACRSFYTLMESEIVPHYGIAHPFESNIVVHLVHYYVATSCAEEEVQHGSGVDAPNGDNEDANQIQIDDFLNSLEMNQEGRQ